jgi:hypothetical protein
MHMLESWVVISALGLEHRHFANEEAATKAADAVSGATIHHLVEAKEKVWVVRNKRGVFIAAEVFGSHEAWRVARDLCDEDDDLASMTVTEYMYAREEEGWTCREEWLGGGW